VASQERHSRLTLVEPGASEAALETSVDSPVEIVDNPLKPIAAVREAWAYRKIAWALFWAVLMQMISRFRLGPTWLLLQTFMSLIGYSIIFGGGIFNVQAPNGMPYFLFTMVGMMGFMLFEQTLMISTRAFQRVKILRQFPVPLVWVPIVGSAQALIRFVLYIAGYLVIVLYLWVRRGHLYLQLSPRLLFISFSGLALCLAFAWGLGMWTAPLYAWAKDVRYAMRYVFRFALFITPVLYPIEKLHGTTRTLAELNPLSSPVEMAKVGLLGVGSVRVGAAIYSTVLIVVILITGIWFIERYGHSLNQTGLAPVGGDDFDDDDDMF
jgi:ABC-type polysaccharide/polyol phosphate export permease